ncbi:MAG: TetR/AcrR family transcriptional regulator [Myxococcales bacterium]|nr:TetR/AcrR family transcriptional regulator [Myxococcales bacterium]
MVAILAAAEAQVVGGGFDALSIHGVAKAVDLTPGALYRYFDSKAALIIALTSRVVEGFATEVNGVLATLPSDAPLARAMAAALAYGELAHHAPHRFGLLSMLLADSRVLVPEQSTAEPALLAAERALDPMMDALERAAERRLLSAGDAAERALLLLTASHGVLQLRKQAQRLPGMVDVHALLRSMVSALLIGWGADPKHVENTLTTLDGAGPLLSRQGDNR